MKSAGKIKMLGPFSTAFNDKFGSMALWMRYFYVFLYALATTALAGLTVACQESREVRVQRFLMRGNEMVRRNSLEQAERFFREALALDSCFADAWNNLGTLQFNRGSHAEAMESYSHALMCRPDFVDALLNRANVGYQLGDWSQALNDLAKAETLKPDTTVIPHLRGLIYTSSREYNKAKREFLSLLEKDSEDAEAWVNLGTVLYNEGKLDSARVVTETAVSLAPNEPNAYNTLALISMDEGQYDRAMDYIGKALTLRPGDPYFLNNRGYLLLKMGRLPEALEDIDKSIVGDPRNAWAYRNKGIYYYQSGDFANAVRLLERAVEMDSTVKEAKRYLELAREKKG
jgi:tetratricopeptide (TPR) repeat protein|nr:MAG: hypothetical protein DIU61_03990 [Bacteroidota bacterium]